MEKAGEEVAVTAFFRSTHSFIRKGFSSKINAHWCGKCATHDGDASALNTPTPPPSWRLCRWVGGRRWEVEGWRRKAEGGMVRWHAKLRSDTFPLCYFLETFKVALECLSWRRKGVSRLQVKGTYDIWQVGEQERSGGDRMEWVARWVG